VRTGGPRESTAPAPDETQPVWLRASGSTTVTLWVGGFAPDVLARLGTGTPVTLQVESIEYVSDGKVIGNVTCDPDAPWTDSIGGVRHTFDHAGKYSVVARVRVRTTNGSEWIESKPLAVTSEGVVLPWMLAAATGQKRDLLVGAHATVTTSSDHAPSEVGAKVCDGVQSTRWLCGPADASPSIVIEVPKAVTCDKLVLSGACVSADEMGRFDRIEQVSVRLNRDKEPIFVDLVADELEPTVYTFEKTVSVSRLEIRVTKRTSGKDAKNQAGFAEIALEKRER
jgi:hypothetical protein